MRSGTKIEINLTLLRHGRTKSNLECRYLGRTDEDLCEAGMRELKSKCGAYALPDVLFVSPMRRCRQSAAVLFPDMAQIVISEWTEIDFGLFEGKNHRELDGNDAYQRWIDSNGRIPFPQGESREAFLARTEKGFQKMCDLLRKKEFADKQVLQVCAVVHGGTIMALLHQLEGGDYFSYQVKNTEGYRCTVLLTESENDISRLKRV